MEREALDALEKRVSTLRVVTAEKAVLARSLAQPEPIRFHNEIATAILALAAFVAFIGGREIGLFAAHGEPCRALRPDEGASLTFTTETYTVQVDTAGYLQRDAGPMTQHPGRTYRRVSPAAVRELANRLVEGCLLDKVPPYISRGPMGWSVLTLQARDRVAYYRHSTSLEPIVMCGGHDHIQDVEGAIMKLGRVDELFGVP